MTSLEPTRPLVSEVSIEQLSDKEWRYAWAHPKIRWAIALQVAMLRQKHGWTRKELARRADISWLSVSRIENQKGDQRLHTLVRIAAAFDCAFVCRFVGWREWLDFMRAMEDGDRSVIVPLSFEEEDRYLAEKRS